MSSYGSLTTVEIKAVFADEIQELGGTLSDVFDDGKRLIARSLLPWVNEVRPDDWVQGGVAIRSDDGGLLVYPYVFRKVCANGAIAVWTLDAQAVEDRGWNDPSMALHETIRLCGAREAFETAVNDMRKAGTGRADILLQLLPQLARLPESIRESMLQSILGRFERERDRTRFGLMNAVTSLARDTPDPDLRWRLETIGGRIASGSRPTKRHAARASAPSAQIANAR